MPFSRRLVPAALAAISVAVGTSYADEPPAMAEPDKAGAKPALKVLTSTEAAPLLEKLKAAAKAKAAEEAIAAIAAIAGTTHPDFEPALAKLLAHSLAPVAEKAAEAIGERAGPKTGATLWKGYMHATNAKRHEVKGAILAAMGAAKAPLDDKQYDEALSVWRLAATPEAMVGFALYFERIRTDKRPCKIFALWLDEPRPANVNDGSNPPASYWEARWKLWNKTKPNAVSALKAITGQTFETTADARKWFKDNPKFGVDW